MTKLFVLTNNRTNHIDLKAKLGRTPDAVERELLTYEYEKWIEAVDAVALLRQDIDLDAVTVALFVRAPREIPRPSVE